MNMRKLLTTLFSVLSLALLLSACQPIQPMPDSGSASADEALKPAAPKLLFETVTELVSNQVHVKARHVTFPVGFKTPEHTHPGPGPRYVLKGEVEVIEAGETNTFRAGEIFWETGVLMTSENIGDEELELIIVELLPVESDGTSVDEALKSAEPDLLFETITELVSNHVNVKVREVTFPVGFKTPEHTHPGPGPRYILQGEVEVIEAGETNTFSAGEIFWETGVLMTSENIGDEELELIIELLPVDHHAHQHEVSPDIAPSVDLEVIPLDDGGYNVHIQTANFIFAPHHVNMEPVEGEGHAHLFIDDVKVARIYGEWYHLESLPADAEMISVGLYTNSHQPLAVDGVEIADTVMVADIMASTE